MPSEIWKDGRKDTRDEKTRKKTSEAIG